VYDKGLSLFVYLLVVVLLKWRGENGAPPAEDNISSTSCLGCHILVQLEPSGEKAEQTKKGTARRHNLEHKYRLKQS